MIYPVLLIIFYSAVAFLLFILLALVFRYRFWVKNKFKILKIFLPLMFCYGFFILFFCGPNNLELYPSPNESEYKLPWEPGLTRFVAQGNRSFVSHRGLHYYAWDFIMPNGSKILASRSGTVIKVEDRHKGIGLKSNYILIKHKDGLSSGYAHIANNSALVKEGEQISRGNVIALSGMVGQTIFPHLHFYVLNKKQTASVPISFSEVDNGVPFAGKSYTSQNEAP